MKLLRTQYLYEHYDILLSSLDTYEHHINMLNEGKQY